MSTSKQQSQNMKIILIVGVSSSQALPGFLITAPPSVLVPAVLGVDSKPKKKKTWFSSAYTPVSE
jgi:hypothetical protein